MKLSTLASRLALGSALLLAASLTACNGSKGGSSDAQPVLRVGLMHVGTDHIPPSLCTLEARLSELGWREGASPLASRVTFGGKKACKGSAKPSSDRNIELIWRNLESGAAPEQAREFVREHVDVIVAFEDQSIAAAQWATAGPKNRIPIVFLHPSDPVRDGLVKSLSHPGGNLTGVFGPRDVVAKQLELYERLVPQLHRVLTLVDPTDPASGRLWLQYRTAAAQLPRPVKLDLRKAKNAKDLRRIFRSLRPGEDNGAFLLSPRLRLDFTALTIRLAKRARLPVQAHRKDWVEQGALFSFGADLGPIGRAGARYVDRILRGASPADLAVEEVPTVEFAINLNTASRLGIKPPQDTIILADKVYYR